MKDLATELDSLVAELHREGARFIFSGMTTIEIDGIEVLIKEALVMKRRTKRGGSPIRKQVEDHERKRLDSFGPGPFLGH